MFHKTVGIILLTLLTGLSSFAQKDEERSVQITSTFNDTTGVLTLEWKASPNATSYRVSRWQNNNWSILDNLDSDQLTYSITDHPMGEVREYRVEKFGGLTGSGYIYTGFEVPKAQNTKRCLVLVDSVLLADLTAELAQWEATAEGDGWEVELMECRTSETVADVKAKVIDWYNVDPFSELSIFIFGHVAVPYSGEINPDAHSNHIGAWPCDGYYGDIQNFAWTDNRVNNTSSSNANNHNVPGDGKFDQNTFPSVIEIPVGRVDFFDLPAFAEGYVELSRQYLVKNHAFRMGEVEIPERGLVENNFASFDEGFGQNGFKNFATMFGPENVIRGDFENDLEDEAYLWAYACGGGSYTSMGGVGNINNLYVNRELNAVFIMNFGSYFGDWDVRNNLLRASLASGSILTNVWAGRPNWQVHHMALGKNIGFSTTLTQNNNFRYTAGFFGQFAHISLLGDPTLRMHPMSPPSALTARENGNVIDLTWRASEDAELGYLIYKSVENAPFELLTNEPVQDTFFQDLCFTANVQHRYMVKAYRLQHSASGSYFNTSIGLIDTVTPTNGTALTAMFDWNSEYEKTNFNALTASADSVLWTFGTGDVSREINPEYTFPSAGEYVVCLTVFGVCNEDVICDTLNLESSLPESYQIQSTAVKCHGDSTGQLAFTHSGSPSLEFAWNDGQMDSVATNLAAGWYSLVVTSITGLEIFIDSIELTQPDALMADVMTIPSTGNDGAAVATVSGGVPPYELNWGDGTLDPTMLPPGDYQVTILDANDCEIIVDFTIQMQTSTEEIPEFNVTLSPNPVRDRLRVKWENEAWKITGLAVTDGRLAHRWSVDLIRDGALLNTDRLPKGNYWIIFEKDDQRQFVPFVKF